MKHHPAAALFPLLAGDELKQLADSIRDQGLLEPIVLIDGQILDGRNRERACKIAGVAPRFETYTGGSPIEYVIAKNLHRRQLTVAQRAVVAVDAIKLFEAEAAERHREASVKGGQMGGRGRIGVARERATPIETATKAERKSSTRAGKLTGVGRTSVETTKAIQQADPEVIDQMRTGEIATVAEGARKAGIGAARPAKTPAAVFEIDAPRKRQIADKQLGIVAHGMATIKGTLIGLEAVNLAAAAASSRDDLAHHAAEASRHAKRLRKLATDLKGAADAG